MIVAEQHSPGALAGIRVLDLSRVLAGPWCTQILADLGAEVFKIEQPGVGDDTRRWGPPFLQDGSNDAAYYLCANRNKASLQIDIAAPQGADLVRRIARDCDIVVENFRVGGLKKYGLDYASLRAIKPSLVYCSITGFGQCGPLSDRGGYDFLVQGMSGLMSITGRADGTPGEGPLKVGIPISDLTTGLYATISILAALRHREVTGEGQHIDLALLDSQIALLSNQASNWMNGGLVPRRLGNEHPNTVPYQDFACADGDVLIAIGNDRQYRAFCKLIGREDLARDPRFATNAGRSEHRELLQQALKGELARWQASDLLARMDAAKLPGGRFQTVPEALGSPHVEARGMIRDLARTDGTAVKVIGFPGRLSATPVTYRKAPPRSGEDTREALTALLHLSDEDLQALAESGVIGSADLAQAAGIGS